MYRDHISPAEHLRKKKMTVFVEREFHLNEGFDTHPISLVQISNFASRNPVDAKQKLLKYAMTKTKPLAADN
jgi:hypothetical protein